MIRNLLYQSCLEFLCLEIPGMVWARFSFKARQMSKYAKVTCSGYATHRLHKMYPCTRFCVIPSDSPPPGDILALGAHGYSKLSVGNLYKEILKSSAGCYTSRSTGLCARQKRSRENTFLISSWWVAWIQYMWINLINSIL